MHVCEGCCKGTRKGRIAAELQCAQYFCKCSMSVVNTQQCLMPL